MTGIEAAVDAINAGESVVYPTETVYGLGADATDSVAVEGVYTLKGRDRDKPVSVAVPDIDAVERVATPSALTRSFIEAFLPGPVTVVCARKPAIPDVVTAGHDRVGIRIPANDVARDLLSRTPPLTSTSANRSGTGAITDPADLAPGIRDGVGAIIDVGETPGGPSTVVDVDEGVIHREGPFLDAIESWLADQADSPW